MKMNERVIEQIFNILNYSDWNKEDLWKEQEKKIRKIEWIEELTPKKEKNKTM